MARTGPVGGRGETVRVERQVVRTGDEPGGARPGHRPRLSAEVAGETSGELSLSLSEEVLLGADVGGWTTGGGDALTPPGMSARLPVPIARLIAGPGRAERLLHVRSMPGRAGATQEWPPWAETEVVEALRAAGIERPWRHQVE